MPKIKLIPVVYVASPYSPQSRLGKLPIVRDIIKHIRFLQVSKIMGKLRDKFNFAMIGPITQSHITGKYRNDNDGGFQKWESDDLSYINKCDILLVVMMSGWDTSVGVRAEIKFARRHKKTILYLDPKQPDELIGV